ncbi:MAG: GDSL-type esterase/lipase family protein [Bacteroidetes bacterium]|nr:GDSL-type esterase/lipase family protein [Bacteroidota bacterium]
MKLRFKYLILLAALALPVIAPAQDTLFTIEKLPVYDSLKALYPFLTPEKNRICGDLTSLTPFFQKLEEPDCREKNQVVVVHIGDSHVQAGYITQPLRAGLQEQFGNAGVGIIFPYRVAKSNGPPGYLTAADTPWVASRNAAIHKTLPTGISGFTLSSNQTSPSFTVEFTSPEIYGNGASLLTVFHASRDSCLAFSVINEINGLTYPVIDSVKDDATTFCLDDHPEKIRIRGIRKNDSALSATFYGMNLRSEEPGVIVHTIGVNGATFASYLRSEHFVEQLAELNPDLLIFSLGTNEAANYKTFEPETFKATIDSLTSNIRNAGIKAAIMFTTPPGIYKPIRKKRRTSWKPNPTAETISNILRDYACANSMTSWDWHCIMGGATAMAKWKLKKMTDKRYIHFSSKGYVIQGMFLLEAINQSYKNYKNP